ncbi:MAG: hypothetical protein ACK40G_03845 [Cytophagaceae bacterium]
MVIHQIFIAIFISGLLTIFLAPVIRKKNFPVIFFFSVVFLIVLIAGRWIPAGPVLNGIYFIPMLISGIIISILLVLFSGPVPPRVRNKYTSRTFEAGDDQDASKGVRERYFYILLWFIILSLLAILILSFF